MFRIPKLPEVHEKILLKEEEEEEEDRQAEVGGAPAGWEMSAD